MTSTRLCFKPFAVNARYAAKPRRWPWLGRDTACFLKWPAPTKLSTWLAGSSLDPRLHDNFSAKCGNTMMHMTFGTKRAFAAIYNVSVANLVGSGNPPSVLQRIMTGRLISCVRLWAGFSMSCVLPFAKAS